MEKAKTLAARSCMHICTLCKYRAVYVHTLYWLSKEGCGWHTWDIVVQGCKKIFLVENKLFLFSIYKSTSPLMEILIYIPILSFPFPVLQNSVVVISNTVSNCMWEERFYYTYQLVILAGKDQSSTNFKTQSSPALQNSSAMSKKLYTTTVTPTALNCW